MYIAVIALTMLVLPVTSVILELSLSPGDSAVAVVGRWFVFWSVGVRLALSQLRDQGAGGRRQRSVLLGRGARVTLLVALVFSPCPPPLQAKARLSVEKAFHNNPAMQFHIVRSAAISCTKNCPEWISAEGTLKFESINSFRKVLRAVGKRRLPILIASGGGSVQVALAIGRMIRAHRLDVAVSSTEFLPCNASRKDCQRLASIRLGEPRSVSAVCASACVLVLASGIHRFVAPWSHVGVHQVTDFRKQISRSLFYRLKTLTTGRHHLVEQKMLAGEKVTSRLIKLDAPRPKTLRMIDRYLVEMGVSTKLQRLMAATAPKYIHWLSHEELSVTRLATEFYGGEQLVAQSRAIQMTHTKHATPFVKGIRSNNSEGKNTTVAYGVTKICGPSNYFVPLAIEFLHREGTSSIQVNGLVEDPALLTAKNPTLTLQFGTEKQAIIVTATSAFPAAPVAATFPMSDMCGEVLINGIIKLTLLSPDPNTCHSPGSSSFLDTHKLHSMPKLLADICRPLTAR